jgi:hypothetical protein
MDLLVDALMVFFCKPFLVRHAHSYQVNTEVSVNLFFLLVASTTLGNSFQI